MSYLNPKRRGPTLFSVIALLILGAGAGLAAAFFAFAPRVTAVSPAGNIRTGSYAAIEIRFSTPMQAACTADHFTVEPSVEGDLVIAGDTLRFTPHSPWPSGGGVRAAIRAGACSARGLPLLAGRSWTFTPSLVRIAYIPSGESTGLLMGLDADGGDPATLAQTPALVQDFDISRRGDFAVLSTGSYGRPGKLWLSRLDGGSAQLLLDCGADSCRDPAISPDGLLVAYTRQDIGAGPDDPALPSGSFIEVLAIADGRIRNISIAGNTSDNPTWSPQGWLSFYDGVRQVVVIDDLAGGQTAVPNTTGAAWDWLPDGSAIIFPELFVDLEGETEGTSSNVYSILFQVEVKTNRRNNLSGTGLLEDASPAVSPDGNRLAFSRNFFDNRWTPGRQLWIMDLRTGSPRQITRSPEYSHSSIHWSPDGARLVYMMFHETAPGDPPEIWSIQADGSNPRRLVVGGFLPKWLP
ncbi:MAG: PD40 domain-containing protein [Anaerolineales bacterium]|nr:PD40 domain-containing protein [Anaerolineales bacterium]